MFCKYFILIGILLLLKICLQLLATMVTYLVVLLQFQISIPDESRGNELDENQAPINETIAETTKITTSTIATTILTTLAKKKKKN